MRKYALRGRLGAAGVALLATSPSTAYAQRVTLGVLGGGDFRRDFADRFFPATPTDAGYAFESGDRGYLIGPAVQFRIKPKLDVEAATPFQAIAFHRVHRSPGRIPAQCIAGPVVTWQFPVLARYRVPVQLGGHSFRAEFEGGPSFRTAQQMNGSDLGRYGGTVGG